jgi:signal transduction histidine kinase
MSGGFQMETNSSTQGLRRTGLEVLGDCPWGTHFCMFFDTKDDLLEILVPFFKTGLTNNEFCFWVLAEPLTEEDARGALSRVMRDSERHLIDRHMEFIPCEECYLSGGTFDLDRVTGEWSARLEHALGAGYDGIRVTGSAGWLQTREWRDFWKYEARLNESIIGQPMIVLCTYPLLGSAGCDILDVTHTHQSAIAKRGGHWEVIETAALKDAKEEIRKLNEELETRVIERTQELQRAQAELVRVERLTTMGEFAASITHEIAQPLAAIAANGNACLNWLESEQPNLEDARAAARCVLQDGNRANEVLRSIRALVQKAEPRVAPLDFGAVVEEALAHARDELTQHKVSVRTEVESHLPPVLGDRIQLQQVLLNVINNAIQAMSGVLEGSRELIIRCKAQPQDEGILLTLQDSGIGLQPGMEDHIFKSLFTTKSDGMGMGLAISRSIITAHGGRIWASPGEPCGAVFQIALASERSRQSERVR